MVKESNDGGRSFRCNLLRSPLWNKVRWSPIPVRRSGRAGAPRRYASGCSAGGPRGRRGRIRSWSRPGLGHSNIKLTRDGVREAGRGGGLGRGAGDPAGRPSRLLKKAHLRTPILRMGTRRAALHLDLFEQPGQKRVFQHPASDKGPACSGLILGKHWET
jgi:hypothetical protein